MTRSMKAVACMLVGFMNACDGHQQEALFDVVDSAGVRIAISNGPLWSDTPAWQIDATPFVSIGEEDGDPRYTLDRVRWPRRLTDGRVIVPNTRSGIVKVYSLAGEYVTQFGRQGEGPGEFRFMARISSDAGDTIRIYDDFLNRITIFMPDGEVVRTVPVEPTGFYYGLLLGWFDDGSFGLAKNIDGANEPPHRDWRDSVSLEWHGPDGSVIAESGVGVGIRRFATSDGRSRVHPFTPRFMAAATSSVVAIGDGYRTELRLLDPRGDLVGMVRWRPPSPRLTSAEFSRFEARVRDLFPEDRLAVFLRALAEAPEPRRVPAYAALLWDELGNLWIRQYDWTTDSNWVGGGYLGSTGPGDWWVFDGEGKWLGTVEVPDGLDVAQIGADYVLAVHKDELDVERVVLHRLSR